VAIYLFLNLAILKKKLTPFFKKNLWKNILCGDCPSWENSSQKTPQDKGEKKLNSKGNWEKKECKRDQ
jgi:hypothetical protein